MNNLQKKTFLGVSGIIFILALSWVYFAVIKPVWVAERMEQLKVDGIFLPRAATVNDFQLVDNTGNVFTQNNLKGHWTLMFFGFTNCGMVCPTTMSALSKMYKTLEKELPATALPQVVMVSVDPERDSVERMNGYVQAFNPHFIGARADMPQILDLEKQLHLVAIKLQADGGKDRYTINHSAEILVFNPEGKLQAYLHYPFKAERLVKDYLLIFETLS